MWPISSNIILVKYQVHSAPLPPLFFNTIYSKSSLTLIQNKNAIIYY